MWRRRAGPSIRSSATWVRLRWIIRSDRDTWPACGPRLCMLLDQESGSTATNVLSEERLPSSDDAVRGAHCRHEAGGSMCSLVRASHLGERTFPSASQSAGAARSSGQLSSPSRAAGRPLPAERLGRGVEAGEADRALAAAQRAGDLPTTCSSWSTRSERAVSTSRGFGADAQYS